jgi:hypothetical protein
MNCVCIDADARRERRQEPPPPPPQLLPAPTARSPRAASCPAACAAAPAVPARTGCDGKLLTDPANIEAEAGVVRDGATVTVGAGLGKIDLGDSACLRLGAPDGPTASFSLSFWIKAGTVSDCFADPVARGERGDGAAIIGKRVDALESAGWKLGACLLAVPISRPSEALPRPPPLRALCLSLMAGGVVALGQRRCQRTPQPPTPAQGHHTRPLRLSAALLRPLRLSCR